MIRLGWILAGGLLLATTAATSVAADGEVCVADDQNPCSQPQLETDALAVLPDADVATTPTDVAAPVDDTPITTRTTQLAPPVVVQPFSGVAAPQSATVEDPLVRTPRSDQKLPPGPPNRYP